MINLLKHKINKIIINQSNIIILIYYLLQKLYKKNYNSKN